MTINFIPFPNDKLFKAAMGQPLVAKEFFKRHLPAEILEHLDFSTLKLEKNSFIDDQYKATEADLLYSIQLDKQKAYLYVVFEQQTTVDHDMAFRLQIYTLRALENHRKQYPHDPLPIVFPLVLYTGNAPWTAALDIFPLFGEQAALARHLWNQPYTLIDVCRIEDDDLLRDQLSGLVQYVFKYRKNQRDFKQFVETVVKQIEIIEKTYPSAAALISALVRYIIDGIQEPDKEDRALLLQKAQESSSTILRGNIVTFAQQFEQIGMDKGISIGFQKGEEKGIQQGEAAILKMLLERRFGTLDSAYLNRLEQASPEQLLIWGERILDALSLNQIFEN
jgi:predicted transposase/invertase (TIGR01784 family)